MICRGQISVWLTVGINKVVDNVICIIIWIGCIDAVNNALQIFFSNDVICYFLGYTEV